MTALAIGYAATPEAAPEEWRARQVRPRERRQLSELVFGERWGEPAALLADEPKD